MTQVQPRVSRLRRGCGYRREGKAYITSATSPWGMPIEHFLVCPPFVVYEDQFGIAPQGISVVDAAWRGQPGVYDAFDWVGMEHYPWVPDFVEEARNFGTSRLPQPNFPFHMLTEDSRHFFLHSRAAIVDPTLPFDNRLDLRPCPKDHAHHNEQPQQIYEMCLALLWENCGNCKDPNKRVYDVDLKCGYEGGLKVSYEAGAAPKEWGLEWQLAVFMWLPITAIEVIYSPMGEHETVMDLLDKLGTTKPYYVVED